MDHSNDTVRIDDVEGMLSPHKINPFFVPIVVTHSITLLIGVLGNVVAIVIMLSDKKSRNSTNIFLVSLAVGDLLLLLVCAPLETIQYFVIEWDADGAVCKMAHYVEMLSAVVSVLNLIAVTLERFIVIVFPLRSRSLCTLSNCRKAVFIVWVVSLFLSIPFLYSKGIYPITFVNNVTSVTVHYCHSIEGNNALIFAVYQFIILFGAPALLMIICYAFVIRVLWRSTVIIGALTNSSSASSHKNLTNDLNHLNQKAKFPLRSLSLNEGFSPSETIMNAKYRSPMGKGEDVKKSRKQVIKMLILVIALFLICWGPKLIMEICLKVGINSFDNQTYRMRVMFYLFPFIHSCLNPFIYSFMSKNFRHSVKRKFMRMWRKDPMERNNANNKSRFISRFSSTRRPSADFVTKATDYELVSAM